MKSKAYEVGANCILELKIDMYEIFGKGKSMFMVTAIGTAVIIDKTIKETRKVTEEKRGGSLTLEKMNTQRKRRAILEEAKNGGFKIENVDWYFISSGQMQELYAYLIEGLKAGLKTDSGFPGTYERFYEKFVFYIDSLRMEEKISLLYDSLESDSQVIVPTITSVIRDLSLFDMNRFERLLNHPDFSIRKRAVTISTVDKSIYTKADVPELELINQRLADIFPEIGTRSIKKGLLSSKEKEVWKCTCGKTVEVGYYCTSCEQDIHGFREDESKPYTAIKNIKETIEIIHEHSNN